MRVDRQCRVHVSTVPASHRRINGMAHAAKSPHKGQPEKALLLPARGRI